MNDESCDYQNDTWRSDSPEGCMKICRETPNCYKFTYVEHATNWTNGLQRCCLKKKVENMKSEAKQGRISGPEDCGNLSIFLY